MQKKMKQERDQKNFIHAQICYEEKEVGKESKSFIPEVSPLIVKAELKFK